MDEARVAVVRPTGSATELTLVGGERCCLAVRPDPGAAERLRNGNLHLGSVRIDLLGGQPRASVVGAARHLPVRRPIPVPAALALAIDGVPTLVRRPARTRTLGAVR